MGSTTTNRHGVAAFDFATVSGCDQLVVGPTHARGGTLDLLMTDANVGPAGGRSAGVSACADLTNRLQCCWVDPAACAWIKH